jgi:hypothetical protein
MQRAAAEFTQPRLEIISRLDGELKSMPAGGGLRTASDPRHPLGARNVDVAPGSLREGDVAVDSYGLLIGGCCAGVGAICTTLQRMDAP